MTMKMSLVAVLIWLGGVSCARPLPMKVELPEAALKPVTIDASKLSKIEAKAIAGESASQLQLGDYYWYGDSARRSEPVKAFEWYRKASATEPAAQLMVMISLQRGQGTAAAPDEAMRLRQNLAEHRDWFIQNAIAGDARCQWWLGCCYAEGFWGMKQDLKESLRMHRMAAVQGYADSEYAIGLACYYGLGVEQDMKQAAQFFETAAAKNHIGAAAKLGVCYAGGMGLPRNVERAKYWIQMAAEGGQSESQEQLGDMLANPPDKDLIKAMSWYRVSARQGNASAARKLAIMEATLMKQQMVQPELPAPSR